MTINTIRPDAKSGGVEGLRLRREKSDRRGAWRRFLAIYRSIRVPWLLYLASLLAGVFASQITLWLAPLTATINRGDFTSATLVPAFVGLTLGSIAVSVTVNMTTAYANSRVERRLRSRVWRKLLRAPSGVIEKSDPPELVSRVMNDPPQMGNALYSLFAAVPSLWGFVGAVIGIAGANAQLSLIFLTIVPVTVIVFWMVGLLQFTAQRVLMDGWGRITGTFTELMGVFGPLKSLENKATVRQAGESAISKMFRAGVLSEALTTAQTLGGSVISNAATIIVFAGGALYVRRGELAQQNLSLYYQLVMTAMPFLFELLTEYQNIKGSQGFGTRLGHVVELPEEDDEQGRPTPDGPIELRFRNVSYAYGDHDALHEVSFRAPAGSTTAIVGANGSGKSTALKLLRRIYDPRSGTIELGTGENIQELSLRSWRNRVSVVPQGADLTSGSIRENIAFADLDAPMAQVERAGDLAGAQEFITEHPLGYAREVGEGGSHLSGGQRQRVAIARALLPDRSVLLMDEADSALDDSTAAAVYRTVREVTQGRTVVLISHRPAAISCADHVVLLHGGRVSAEGTHDELLASNAEYRGLIQPGAAPSSGTTKGPICSPN